MSDVKIVQLTDKNNNPISPKTSSKGVIASNNMMLEDFIDDKISKSGSGSVTSVSVKMNDTVKGTVTTSGTIDLGTVLTEHQDISKKLDVAHVSLENQTTTLLALTKALVGSTINDTILYRRWYTRSDGGAANISDKPVSGSVGFVCEAMCNRLASVTDYRYVLICYVRDTRIPYVAVVKQDTTALSWTSDSCLGANYANSFWGMREPGGGDNWIRTSTNGIIPYASGGVTAGKSNIGTSGWYFNSMWASTFNGCKYVSTGNTATSWVASMKTQCAYANDVASTSSAAVGTLRMRSSGHRWAIQTLADDLYITSITNANYDAGTNTLDKQYRFETASGKIYLTPPTSGATMGNGGGCGILRSDGKVGMVMSGGSTSNKYYLALQEDGNLVWYQNGSAIWSSRYGSSSRRFKHNIKDMTEERALKLLDVKPVTFDYNDDQLCLTKKTDKAGFIAEDIEKIIDDVVTYETLNDGTRAASTIEYASFTPYLVKLCQIQQKQIDDLTKRVEALENKKEN